MIDLASDGVNAELASEVSLRSSLSLGLGLSGVVAESGWDA